MKQNHAKHVDLLFFNALKVKANSKYKVSNEFRGANLVDVNWIGCETGCTPIPKNQAIQKSEYLFCRNGQDETRSLFFTGHKGIFYSESVTCVCSLSSLSALICSTKKQLFFQRNL